VSFLSKVLCFLCGCLSIKRVQHRSRVECQPACETLETKTVPSASSIGASALGLAQHVSMPVLATAQVQLINAMDATAAGRALTAQPPAASIRIASQFTDHSGITAATAAATIGKANGSGKIAPKDTGGVELTKALGSSKLGPKDTGGVELSWVDYAVTGRPGSKYSSRV
jgi:hypothetical protein